MRFRWRAVLAVLLLPALVRAGDTEVPNAVPLEQIGSEDLPAADVDDDEHVDDEYRALRIELDERIEKAKVNAQKAAPDQ